jgi:hypothetical protein
MVEVCEVFMILVSYLCKMFLIGFPAWAPGGVPAPDARHQRFWFFFRSLSHWAGFTRVGFGFVCRHFIS